MGQLESRIADIIPAIGDLLDTAGEACRLEFTHQSGVLGQVMVERTPNGVLYDCPDSWAWTMRSDDHRTFITIREIGQIKNDVREAVTWSLRECLTRLRDQRGHLFVTLVEADGFRSGDSAGVGLGLYHEGIQHVAIAAGDPPSDFPGDRDAWLSEVQLTTAHEFLHWLQDLNGTLGQDDDGSLEEATERQAREIVSTTSPRSKQ